MSRTAEGLAIGCLGSDHVWGVIHEGSRKHLRSIRFLAHEENLGLIERRFEASGLLNGRDADGALLGRSPDGLLIEVAAGEKCSPKSKAPFDFSPAHSPGQASPPRSLCARVQPRRLSHIALHTGDLNKALAFFSDVVGVRLSDRSGSNVAFMHGAYGSDHHLIALAQSESSGLHHSSWEVSTVDQVGRGAEQMREAGYSAGWGLGRHVLGSNYFHYVRDPWGSYAEYSAGMDYIPHGTNWQAKDHPGEDSFYQWGPPPPDDFVTNYETVFEAAVSVD